ncbi:MAG: hypothetical protein NXI22_19220 [bacterium]|nr:hypothetical protein [bacterium]
MKTTMRSSQLADLKTSLEKRINHPPNNIVTFEHLGELDAARNYDAASSYNYLFAELMAIKHAVARGRLITINTTPVQTLDSVGAFMDWALTRYPAFVEAGYHDLYLDPVELIWGEGC